MLFIENPEDIMIGDTVPYQWGNAKAPCYAEVVGIRIVTNVIGGNNNPRAGVFIERTYTINDQKNKRIRDGYEFSNFKTAARNRLEQFRKIMRDSQEGKPTLDMSYGDMSELEGLAAWIEAGDVELAEPAGIPEEEFAKR